MMETPEGTTRLPSRISCTHGKSKEPKPAEKARRRTKDQKKKEKPLKCKGRAIIDHFAVNGLCTEPYLE